VPIQVAAHGIEARAILWRKGSASASGAAQAPSPDMLTVVAKVSFVLRAGAPTWAASEPLTPWSPASPARADDLVPFKPRADLLVTGAALGRARTALAYSRGPSTLVHKTAPPQQPFAPSPSDLGPIGRAAPSRARRLAAIDASALDGDAIVLPGDLDPAFFQCAPDDQQLDAIVPGDVVRVMGDQPRSWAIEWYVPVLHMEAHMRVDGGASSTSALRPDCLLLDMDRQTAALVLRAQLIAPPEHAPTSLAVGMSLSGAPMAWPPFLAPRPRPPIAAPSMSPSRAPLPPAQDAVAGTMMFSDGDVQAARRLAAMHGFTPSKSRAPAPPPTFGPPPPRSFGPSPPAPEAPSPTRPGGIEGTMLQSDLEVARLAAMAATPFDRQSGLPVPAPPPDGPPAGEPFATMFVFPDVQSSEDRPSGLPFVAGPAPAMPSAAAGHVAEPSGTMAFDPALIAQLRASQATPFAPEPKLPPPLSRPPAEPRPPEELPITPEPPKEDPLGTMVFGDDHRAMLEALRSTPFRAATEEDVPVQLPAAFTTERRADDIGGTMFGLDKAVAKARVARVVPFRPQRVSVKLVEEESREGLGKVFLDVLARLSA